MGELLCNWTPTSIATVQAGFLCVIFCEIIEIFKYYVMLVYIATCGQTYWSDVFLDEQ